MPDENLRAREDRRPIGEIFVELGFVSRAQLDAALDEQHATGGRIGEILVEQGSLTRIDLASALAEHWQPPAYAEEGESIEDSLDGAERSVTELRAGQPALEPDPTAGPRRGLLDSNPDERLLELSLRIDRAARDSHDRIAALAEELRVELATKSARVEAQLQARLEEAAALEKRFAEVQEAASGALAGAEERTAELHVEIGSLAGRLDELFGLRHADAQMARVANERLGTRLEGLIARQAGEAAAALAVAMDSRDDPGIEGRVEESLDRLTAEVAELTRRLEQQDALQAESQRAVLAGLTTLRKRLKKGKTGKGLRRSLDSLDAAIVAADARLAERDSIFRPES